MFDIPDFDIINDVPNEYMHNVCLGVVKLLFLLTFDVGVSRIKGIRHQIVTQLSEKLLAVKNPSEFSRRTQIIDFANFKAQEWQNFFLFFFSTCD